MQLLNSYQLPPGQCTCCGGCETPVIDTERSYDEGFQRLYICHACIKSMANEFGFLPVDKVEHLRAQLADARSGLRAAGEQILALEAERDEQKRIVDTVRELGLVKKPRAPRAAVKASA